MGWFDKQTRDVMQSDQELFEESLLRMASVVLNDEEAEEAWNRHIITKEAVDEILKYYKFKPVEIPAGISDPGEQLEYSLRPYGIMRREVLLKDKWYRDSFGPLLVFRKEDGRPVALIPRRFSGYSYTDPRTGAIVKLTGEKAEQFGSDAICFYKPLPTTELSVSDLRKFLYDSVAKNDRGLFFRLAAFAALVGLLTPFITRFMTGVVIRSGDPSLLLGSAVFLVCSIISQQLINMVKGLTISRMCSTGGIQVEAALMMRLINLPASFFHGWSAGELYSRFRCITDLTQLVISDVYATGTAAVMSLIYILQILRFTPALVIPAIAVILATVTVSGAAGYMQIRNEKIIMERAAKTSGLTYSLISGIQKIKLAGAEKRAFSKWSTLYTRQVYNKYNLSAFIRFNKAIILAISLAGTIALYSIAVAAGVSPSEYIAFNSAFGMIAGAFTSLAGVGLTIAKIRPVYEMVEPILTAVPESSANRAMVTSLEGNIEFSNVFFRYKENMPYVIEGLNLSIREGEYIAVVGPTGCGKTTLMRLLLGFEMPDRGAIYYDGRDITRLDLRSLRRKMGVVTQDGSLFQGSIRANILICAPPGATIDDAWAAAEIAGIADDIRRMPMGMHTMISEGQGGISGGQKQCLMIARAVAAGPRVLLFDEATSALDNKTQKKISGALDQMKCTRIVIAHRLSTIKNSDRILMLDEGRIVEDGTYEELIARNGRFAELVARQRIDL